MNHLFKWSLLAAGLVLACGLAGCRKSTTVTAPDGSRVTVTKKGGGAELNVTMPDGGKMRISGGEEGVALPEDFPKDVPVFPGAKVTAAMTTGDMLTVALSTAEPLAKASAFYKENLKASGWTTASTFETADGAALQGSKDGRSLVVSISGTDKETVVTLMVEQKKK